MDTVRMDAVQKEQRTHYTVRKSQNQSGKAGCQGNRFKIRLSTRLASRFSKSFDSRYQSRSLLYSDNWAEVGQGLFFSADEIVWRDGSKEERFPLREVKIQGVHNIENIMAAIAAAKCAGVSRGAIQRTLEEFPGLEHRLEFVREKDGVRYFNDSKGTNVGAVVKSLASFSAPVILLAGGVGKGGEYAPLAAGVVQKVRRLVLFGEAKQTIANALGHLTTTVMVDDIAAAVRDAAQNARPGDVVLL